MQFTALVADTFRSLKARSLFWVILAITLMFTLMFGSISVNERGVSLFFGAWEAESTFIKPGTAWEKAIYFGALDNLMDWWLMSFGMLIMLFPATTIFPDTMAAGTVDLLLSKPISRLQLFLAKYLGALLFVAFHAGVMVLGCFITLAVRLQEFHWQLFYGIGLAVLLFSLVFCFNVLMGILTRSSVAALLWTLLFWFILWSIQFGRATADAEVVRSSVQSIEGDAMAQGVTAFVETVDKLMIPLPKTRSMSTLFTEQMRVATPYGLFDCMVRSSFASDEEFERSKDFIILKKAEQRAFGDPLYIIGTSLAFEAVILLLAYWRFSKIDF